MSTAVFSNVARRDFLEILDQGKPRYDKVAKLLDFGNSEIAQAAGVPKSKVQLNSKMPPEIAERFIEWVVVLNLVAQFFEGDAGKTYLWFTMPNPLLGGIKPRDMLRVGRFRRLYQFITDALTEDSPPDAVA